MLRKQRRADGRNLTRRQLTEAWPQVTAFVAACGRRTRAVGGCPVEAGMNPRSARMNNVNVQDGALCIRAPSTVVLRFERSGLAKVLKTLVLADLAAALVRRMSGFRSACSTICLEALR